MHFSPQRWKYPVWNNNKTENQDISVFILHFIVCVRLPFSLLYPVQQDIAISQVNMKMNYCWHHISSYSRYQPVVPYRWTDPVLSKLWELPSLTGKLQICATLDTLPVNNWASITWRFLSDKRCWRRWGRGLTKLNNTCPVGLAICPPLCGAGAEMTVGGWV